VLTSIKQLYCELIDKHPVMKLDALDKEHQNFSVLCMNCGKQFLTDGEGIKKILTKYAIKR